MIKKNSKVRHIDPIIDSDKGVMSVLEIKNGMATCWYQDFSKMEIAGIYLITDLILSK